MVDQTASKTKNFNLVEATEEDLKALKYRDRDVWLIKNFILKIPQTFVTNVEQRVEERRREEAEKEEEPKEEN